LYSRPPNKGPTMRPEPPMTAYKAMPRAELESSLISAR